MDPPAESGTAPAVDQTTGAFGDQTSITPPLLTTRPKIVLWGDSLTQTCWEGWGAQLAHRYQRRADVVNRGMSGYNTAWYLQLPDDCDDRNVALCTIWFGANDASLPALNPHHHVSLEDYQRNLKAMVQKAQQLFHTCPLLLITPPPVHHGQRLDYQRVRYGDQATGVLERTLENSGKYAAACAKVAAQLGVPCLNLWQAFQDDAEGEWGRFLSDGLHFSAKGHAFVFSQLMATIQTEFPHLVVEPCAITGQPCNSGSKSELPTFGPYHDEIDATNPDVAMKQAFQELHHAATTSTQDGTASDSGRDTNIATNGGSSGASPPLKKVKMDAP